MTSTATLLEEYQRLLKEEGPDSQSAYALVMSHLDEADFVRLAGLAQAEFVQRMRLMRFLVIFAPIYLCVVLAFALMMWFL